MTDKHRKVVAIICFIIFLAFCGLVGWKIGVPMVQLADEPAQFRAWVESYGFWSRLIFIGMVALQVIVAFIPGEPIELAAGYAFGFVEGTLLTLAGFLIGSTIIFLLVRKFGRKLVEVFFPSKKIDEFGFLKNPKKTKVIAFILMLIPGTPKDFLSYFAGLTQLGLWQWLLIVAVGRLPSLITSTATGAAAGNKNPTLTIIMILVTIVITVAGIVYYRKLCKDQNAEEKMEHRN